MQSKYDLVDEIKALQSIINKKKDDNFNAIISALRDNNFQKFLISTNNLNEARLLEVRLSEINVRVHEIEKEVEDIGKQVDSL